MTTNPDEAIEFLKKLYPDGPWTLNAIDPTGQQKLLGVTFWPEMEKDLRGFLKANNETLGMNVYFSVNPGRMDLTGEGEKYDRKEIKEVRYFQVDMDPEKHEDREEGRKACLARLTSERPEAVPEPTFVIDSGNGYWGLWRLLTPLPLNATDTWANEAARFNRELAVKLTGDAASTDVSRIARLPGTINYPNKKKLEAGYEPVMSKLMNFHDVGYDVSEFGKSEAKKQVGAVQLDQSVDIEEYDLEDLDQLLALGVSHRTCNIIRDGYDEFTPSRWGGTGNETEGIDRSQMVYFLTCELLRKNVPNEMIVGFLSSPAFKASDHANNGQVNGPIAYMYKQIKHALEKEDFSGKASPGTPVETEAGGGNDDDGKPPREATGKLGHLDPTDHEGLLNYMNARHAYILSFGGRMVVTTMEKREEILGTQYMKPADIVNFYDNQIVLVPNLDPSKGPKIARLGAWWRQHQDRRSYQRVDFLVDDNDPDAYNIYQGFDVEPVEGDCEIYLEHILENLCNGNVEHYDYLINWMARGVQHPEKHGCIAVVMRGLKGTGKSAFVNWYSALWHPAHSIHTSNSKMVTGDFTSHLMDKVLLFADEAFFAGDGRNNGPLKTLITEATMVIHRKQQEAFQGRNHLKVIMASNSDWVVPATGDERRYFVLDVGDARRLDNQYFEAIRKCMENGGREALLYKLLNHDISDFSVWDVPHTKALQKQVYESLNDEQGWWLTKLEDGVLLKGKGWLEQVPKEDLREDYARYIKDYGHRYSGVSPTRLGQRMKEWGVKIDVRASIPGKGQKNCFGIPTVVEARRIWDELFGEREWSEPLRPDPVAHEGEKPPF